MTESKFTSGPWEIDWPAVAALGKYERVLIGADGRNGGIYVAHAFGPHREANAHLIAAAPELYGALELLLDLDLYMDGEGVVQVRNADSEEGRKAVGAAIDALAKARGESK